MTAPTTVEAVIAHLRLPESTRGDVEPVVAAVTALIERYRGPEPAAGWPANVELGATMLAARVYRRRNSPAGVESLGEAGPVYVSRNDPDLAQLLELGRYARPAVG